MRKTFQSFVVLYLICAVSLVFISGQRFTRGRYFPDGTAASPSLSFASDTDTGVFHNAANDLGFTIGGTAELLLSASALRPNADAGLTLGTSSLRFTEGHFSSFLAMGTDPSDAGGIRLANNLAINWESAPTGTDITGISVDASENVVIGTNATGIQTANVNHGFFAATPVAQAAAYVQTFATADRTHANSTFGAVSQTASTQTTPFGYSTAAQADAITAELNDLADDVADLKQLVNSVIDDLQAYGLAQ